MGDMFTTKEKYNHFLQEVASNVKDIVERKAMFPPTIENVAANRIAYYNAYWLEKNDRIKVIKWSGVEHDNLKDCCFTTLRFMSGEAMCHDLMEILKNT